MHHIKTCFLCICGTLLAATLAANDLRITDANPLLMPPPGAYNLRILSPSLLELTLITTKAPDPAPVQQWNFVSNGVFVPPSPSQFRVTAGSLLFPVRSVGFKRRPLYAPLAWRDLRIGNYLYLQLTRSLSEGASVCVTNPSGQLWDPSLQFTNTVDPLRWNPAIHVNQQGYLLGAPKKAMVGYYLGSFGEMDIDATQNFSLLDASDQVVFVGPLAPRPDVGYTYMPAPYQKVFQADFTDFNLPGQYRLHIPGLGTSFFFNIGDELPAAFARTCALGLYHQRCGTSNALPFTRYTHAPCHAARVEVPTMQFTKVNETLAQWTAGYASNPRHTAPRLQNVNSSLYPFIITTNRDVSGGHHDAGDYSKYTIDAAQLIHALIFAIDNFPGAACLDNLGLPESGDGIGDLIQEAKWEADFLAKMQDADGGFYFLVYPRDREYEYDVLPDVGDPQVVYPKNTAATAAAVAALAQTASSPLFQVYYPSEAALYLEKACQGWAFLRQAIATYGRDGSYQLVHHYGNTFMHDDELAWAATELYLATGDPAYHADLLAHFDPADPDTLLWGWWRLFESYGCAIRSYAFASRNGRLNPSQLDPVHLAKCETELLAAANDQLSYANAHAYGSSFPIPSKAYRTAGWYFSLNQAFDLVTAYQLDPQPDYFDAILSNLNYDGGCNPLNLNFLTGMGRLRQREIVHQYAQNDSRILPPSGLPLGNIQQGFPWLQRYGDELSALCFPADNADTGPYPFYDRWGDTFNTMTEFVSPQQARILATTAFLMARTSRAAQPWTNDSATIQDLPPEAPAGTNLHATLTCPTLDLSSAEIVWESKDNEPGYGPAYTFSPLNPGQQWIEAEAMLPDGRRVFATSSVNVSFNPDLPPNSYQSNALAVTPDLAALYHFDNSLIDATGKQTPIALQGGAFLDPLNVGWMATRQGTALRIQHVGDQAVAVIQNSALAQADTECIAIDAMIYANAFPWRSTNLSLTCLEANWSANLQFLSNPYLGRIFLGGVDLNASGDLLQAAFTTNCWHHLRMAIDRNGYTVALNGQILVYSVSPELRNWPNNGVSSLTLGNFDGWIDELVIESIHFQHPLHLSARMDNSHPIITASGTPGLTVCLESSTNLITWQRLLTNYLAPSFDYLPTNTPISKSHFFRIATPH